MQLNSHDFRCYPGNQIPVPVRFHHGLCICFFEGRGYDRAFTEHMHSCIAFLEQENPEIQLVLHTDCICAGCPHRNDLCCESEEKVQYYDNMVLKYCNLAENQILHWHAFQTLVQQKILMQHAVADICRHCQWLSVCEEKQKDMNQISEDVPAEILQVNFTSK